MEGSFSDSCYIILHLSTNILFAPHASSLATMLYNCDVKASIALWHTAVAIVKAVFTLERTLLYDLF